MEVTFDLTEDILVANLEGELDHHGAGQIRDEIDGSMKAFGANHLILNYSGVRFMDSSGIGIVMGRYNTVKARKGIMIIVVDNPAIERILSLSGIFLIVEKKRTKEEAVAFIFEQNRKLRNDVPRANQRRRPQENTAAQLLKYKSESIRREPDMDGKGIKGVKANGTNQ